MRHILAEQQTAYFAKNGHLEVEFKHPAMAPSLKRDTWRENKSLADFLVRKMGPLALSLTGKKQIRLACDQWFCKENRPASAGLIKEHFSIQGLTLGLAIAKDPVIPDTKSPLGLLPVPQDGHVLFFKPSLILDWPHVACDIYMAFFALPDALYIQNPKDPATNFLKQLGYTFGDHLTNEFHPLIM